MMFPVRNPSTGDIIAQVPDQGAQETSLIIKKAQSAFQSWSRKPPKERGDILKKWYQLTLDHVIPLAKILHEEQGKPLSEAEEEIYDGALFFEWSVEEAKRIHGYTPLSPDPNRRFMTLKQPIGVVSVITPWNFPSAIPLQKCLPAIAAGCTVILKPSEETPLSALEHEKLAKEAGLPEGVFNILTCQNPQNVSQELLKHPAIRKLTFTGSTQVGRQLMKEGALTVKKISLELGGNSPFLVFEDANLDLAVKKALEMKFYNCGQMCNTINRFLLHDKVYDAFIGKFQEQMAQLSLGPLINEKAVEKIERLLANAQAQGATIVGGKREGLFFQPTLLKNVTSQMDLYHEEIFGPIAPFYRFSTDEEAIQIANDTEYGLAAYIFTENLRRSYRFSEALEAGSVGINTTDVYSELLPFGGWKQSGLGREMGLENSLNPFLETKSLVIGSLQML